MALASRQDYAQAKAWYQKAADQGDAFAQAALERLQPIATPQGQYEKGSNYYDGTETGSRDYEQASIGTGRLLTKGMPTRNSCWASSTKPA